MSFNLTEHFRCKDFACKCCNEVKLDRKALDILTYIRTSFGIPIKVTCGYRCVKHNKEVGSDNNSLHLLGWAIDFIFMGYSVKDMRESMVKAHKELKWGGLGIYVEKNFFHIDTGAFRSWEE